MEDIASASLIAKLIILLIGVASAALVVTIYHCITIGWCNRGQRTSRGHQRTFVSGQQEGTLSSMENSIVGLIPSHKYEKGMGLVGEDGICAVCLCEFEEGEELRSLPECKHTYHVACIDMWLFSHSSCPMCRADATPSPYIEVELPNLGAQPHPVIV